MAVMGLGEGVCFASLADQGGSFSAVTAPAGLLWR